MTRVVPDIRGAQPGAFFILEESKMPVYEPEPEEIAIPMLEEETACISASALYWALKNRSIVWVL